MVMASMEILAVIFFMLIIIGLLVMMVIPIIIVLDAIYMFLRTETVDILKEIFYIVFVSLICITFLEAAIVIILELCKATQKLLPG